MPNAVTPTTMMDAQRILAGGYKGLRDDLSIVMGWPVSRVRSIAKGNVPDGLAYGSKNSQAQAVVFIGQRLIDAQREYGDEQEMVSISDAHWWRLSPEIRAKIQAADSPAQGSYRILVARHVAQALKLASKVKSEE